eukprot:CAMPEP_0177596306 /NCGR_PEP_ID=MMETSP0419_2-20121207/10958_1 /TAXON_ID=582737 /ORGANISM="Tetraselmis sp., Strain GSL018" /LENGTH=304 /DNA_ID=CAMNT_0019088101 /DNA_START=1 /DNA_END=912 /DNA_ORIENTATION=-
MSQESRVADGVNFEIRCFADRGRGIVLRSPVASGGLILVEEALAWTYVDSEPLCTQAWADAAEGGEPVEVASQLLCRLFEENCVQELESLDPGPLGCGRKWSGYSHPGFASREKELQHGCACVRLGLDRGVLHQGSVPDLEIQRLLLVVMLNAHALQPPGGCGLRQGIFTAAAMTNHSCEPNAVHLHCDAPAGHGDGRAAQWMQLRAVRDIAAGEEVTISYLDDLTLPLPERVSKAAFALRELSLCPVLLRLRELWGGEGDKKGLGSMVGMTLLCLVSSLGNGWEVVGAEWMQREWERKEIGEW